MTETRTPETWAKMAERVFAAYPSVATVSVVSTRLAAAFGYGDVVTNDVVQVASAALPTCFINSAVADLLPDGDVKRQIEAATLRGLHHVWIVTAEGAAAIGDLVPAPVDERVILAALPLEDEGARPIALGIDAAWLLGGESGAQVFVFELLKAMSRDVRIERIVLLSDRGVVPAALDGVAKVSGRAWTDAIASANRLDVLHRPYQPGADTDFGRYRQVARAVAVTILDCIAYDNPSYHESTFAFRTYQRAFDEKVCEADQVFAISRHIGDRLQRQFAHRLLAPVQSVHLGTDHLDLSTHDVELPLEGALAQVARKQYVAVLGNDFAHKNRDFAVKVFAEMCRRGYRGRLVLAGFHLDAGSSFDYELNGAGEFADRVLRVGALPGDQKTRLLRNAEAVLYPTSSEGFGLIPFEAAALGTPTAFVRFGPLAETMPVVPAAAAWRVGEFTDHVFALLANPAAFVAAVNEARRQLTWARCADATITGYQRMLRDDATWHRAVAERRGPDRFTRISERMSEYWRRAARRARRLAGPRERTQ